MTASSIRDLTHRGNVLIFPAVVTLSIHGLLGFVLITNWTLFTAQDWEIVSQPKVIEAHLIRIDSRNDPPPKKVEKTKSSTITPLRSTKKVAKVSEHKLTEPKETLEEKSIKAEDSREDFVDLMSLLAAEEQAFQTKEEDNISVSYTTAIQRKVIRYWSRPPSARNGMKCIIGIQLVPTGEVVTSSILTSSGNKAFDLSALNAVKKAGSFPELKKLSSPEFERKFRRFRLLFRPEDLRY